MNIGEFLNQLALKAGVKPDDETLKNVLSAPDLMKIVIPDELVTHMDNNLLSVDSAKNNHPVIRNHYYATAYNLLDDKVKAFLEENGYDDDFKNEVLGERHSATRAILLMKKIKEAETAKQDASSKSDKSELQKQINELHAQLKTEKDALAQERTNFDKRLKDIRIGDKKKDVLGKYQTIYDELPVDAKNAAIEQLILKSLQDKDAEFGIDEKDNLILVKKDGTNLFSDNHSLETPQTFVDKIMSQNKILKVTTPKSDTEPKIVNPATPVNGTLKEKLQASLNSYQTAVSAQV